MISELVALAAALERILQMLVPLARGQTDQRFEQLHETQLAILDLIANRPGIALREIEAALGLNRGTASYHLRRLVRMRLIAPLRGGRATHFLVSDLWPDEPQDMAALLRARCLELALAVANRPGAHQKLFLEKFGSAPPSLISS